MAKKNNPLETPMMKQYLKAKQEHPECLLFMRMGDFYELFLEDAREAGRILGITVTSRNKNADHEVPMAGFPHHSLQQYLPKLLRLGKKVAIMDQLENPAEAEGIVKRGLTRIITPGTLLDESTLEEIGTNYLVALTEINGTIGVAALDCSTGLFSVEEADGENSLSIVLARLQPAELLLPESVANRDDLNDKLQDLFGTADLPVISTIPSFAWNTTDASRFLCEELKVSNLDGFGVSYDETHLHSAAAAALRYAKNHAFNDLAHIQKIERIHHGSFLLLDNSCRRNLDIVKNSTDGSKSGTLFSVVNKTRTAAGARLLSSWLVRPLADKSAIEARHEVVDYFVNDDDLRYDLRDALKSVYDLERLLTKIAIGRANARDLVQLSQTLISCKICKELITSEYLPKDLQKILDRLKPEPELQKQIETTLIENPPLSVKEGGMIRDGFDHELDELRGIKDNASEWLANYQATEADKTGIPKIKVGYNKVFGYFLEVTKSYVDKVPDYFIRKQTLVNAERYITPELKEYEDKALSAEDRIRTKESYIFGILRESCEKSLPVLQECAKSLAELDVFCSFANIARQKDWCRPEIDDSKNLSLKNSRHPVIEEVIGRDEFVANDCRLTIGEENNMLGIITGPNMAGKSTYIRQVALAVILAQAGCFVPADHATIGLVDRLFTRIGAGDELSRNMSTFMVEMAETAAILNNSTEKSLVILDEVGRGTSTFDGVSLAWAITEYLNENIKCKCLFATHYHELTDLAEKDGIFNLTVAVAEKNNSVAFLHRIVNGAATKSYGIHVAKLAGVPAKVITRSEEVLETLEELNVSLSETETEHSGKQKKNTVLQTPELTETKETPKAAEEMVEYSFLNQIEVPPSETLKKIKALDLDNISPRDALNMLYDLKKSAKEEK